MVLKVTQRVHRETSRLWITNLAFRLACSFTAHIDQVLVLPFVNERLTCISITLVTFQGL